MPRPGLYFTWWFKTTQRTATGIVVAIFVRFVVVVVFAISDVRMLGVRLCGRGGCQEVSFPDPVDGATEDDCNCTSPGCDVGTVNYCYFTVLDTGTDRICPLPFSPISGGKCVPVHFAVKESPLPGSNPLPR